MPSTDIKYKALEQSFLAQEVDAFCAEFKTFLRRVLLFVFYQIPVLGLGVWVQFRDRFRLKGLVVWGF